MKKSKLLLFLWVFACLIIQVKPVHAQSSLSSNSHSMGMKLQNEKSGETIFIRCADEQCQVREYVLSSPTKEQILATLKANENFRLTLNFMDAYFDSYGAWPDRKYFHRVDGNFSDGRYDGDEVVSILIFGTVAPAYFCFMYQQYGYCPLIPIGIAVDLIKAPVVLAGAGLYYVGLKTAGFAQELYLENKAEILVRTTRKMATQLEDTTRAGEIEKISPRRFERIKTAIETYYPF